MFCVLYITLQKYWLDFGCDLNTTLLLVKLHFGFWLWLKYYTFACQNTLFLDRNYTLTRQELDRSGYVYLPHWLTVPALSPATRLLRVLVKVTDSHGGPNTGTTTGLQYPGLLASSWAVHLESRRKQATCQNHWKIGLFTIHKSKDSFI